MGKQIPERNFVDSISDFVDKNSKHGFEIVMIGLANIVSIFLIIFGNTNNNLIWGVFGFIIIEIIIASTIYYKKEICKIKLGK